MLSFSTSRDWSRITRFESMKPADVGNFSV
jgi:hypothetical protein